MESATATTTRDILGLALLAALFEKATSRSAAVDAVRGLCLPWLTPTREVVAVRYRIACAQAELDVLAGASLPGVRFSSPPPPPRRGVHSTDLEQGGSP